MSSRSRQNELSSKQWRVGPGRNGNLGILAKVVRDSDVEAGMQMGHKTGVEFDTSGMK